jgi:tRNA A58 N-methylase Trm61
MVFFHGVLSWCSQRKERSWLKVAKVGDIFQADFGNIPWNNIINLPYGSEMTSPLGARYGTSGYSYFTCTAGKYWFHVPSTVLKYWFRVLRSVGKY